MSDTDSLKREIFEKIEAFYNLEGLPCVSRPKKNELPF